MRVINLFDWAKKGSSSRFVKQIKYLADMFPARK
jgi:hypothetical protein